MGTIHNGLTFSIELQPNRIEDLKKLLNELQANFQYDNPKFLFKNLTTTHFITWVILDAQQQVGGKALPDRLLLMTSFAGSKSFHIDELVKVGLQGLHEVHKFGVKYPFQQMPSHREMVKYLKKIHIYNAFYTGFQYVTKDLVRKQHELHESIQIYLDTLWKNEAAQTLSPREVRQKIQEHVKKQPHLKWATKPYKRSWNDFMTLFGKLIILTTVLGGALILTILHFILDSSILVIGPYLFFGFFGSILLLLGLLRINEGKSHIPVEPVTDARILEITSLEDHPVKNEMSVVSPLKPGWIRRIFLALTLRIVPVFRAFSYIPTVHTARWLQTDGGRRLIFIAYYDNTSEGYAHDFVDSTKRTRNLNLIFGHGHGFPPTRWAVKGGGKDRKGYITGVRAGQKITNLWYTTYPKLGVLNIVNNREIHKGLFKKMNDEEIENFLLKL